MQVFERTDLVQLSVGTENEGQDMKHFDPYHTASLVPFRETQTITGKIKQQQRGGDTGVKVTSNKEGHE